MDSLNIASVLKQMGEIARRQGVVNKKKDIDKMATEKRLADSIPINDVGNVQQKDEEMPLSTDETFDVVKKKNSKKESNDEEEEKKSKRLKEDYKANFLDITE